MLVEFAGKEYEVDHDGFLLDPSKWDPEWVTYIKNDEGITELTADHWVVINFVRKFYEINTTSPMVRKVSEGTQFSLKKIYELFPSGPGKGACKMAGLPRPSGCI